MTKCIQYEEYPPDSCGNRRVDSDLECAICGYNLRTLCVSGLCPECGSAVDRTIQERKLFGKGGRRRFLRRAFLANLLATYLPAVLFFLIPVADLRINIILAAACPFALVVLLASRSSPALPMLLLIAAMLMSGVLPYLATRLCVWITRHSRLWWIVPIGLLCLILLQVAFSLNIIASVG